MKLDRKTWMAVGGALVITSAIVVWWSHRPRPREALDALATVRGRPLTVKDLGVRMDRLGALSPGQIHDAVRSALERKIDTDLLVGEAERLGLALDASEREALRATEPLPEVLDRQLRDEGRSIDAYRAEREREALARRVIERQVQPSVRVAEADIATYVAAHRAELRTRDRYRLHAIFVSAPERSAPAHRAAALDRAERAKALLKTRRFEDVARLHSDGIEGARGGDLGVVLRGDPPIDDEALAAAVTGARVGALSDVVEAAAGFWILRVDERLPPADLPPAEMRAHAEAALRREGGERLARAYLQTLRARASVAILLAPRPGGAPDGAARP